MSEDPREDMAGDEFPPTDVCKFCGITREAFNRTSAPCSQLTYPHTFRAAASAPPSGGNGTEA